MSGSLRRFTKLLLGALAVIALLEASALRHPSAMAGALHDSIRDSQRKVVKIYGAGGVSDEQVTGTSP